MVTRLRPRPSTAALLNRLSEHSAPYADPVACIDWSRLDPSRFWLPGPALSLAGDADFDALPAPIQRRLSQFEFLQLLQGGLWVEGLFMERIARHSLQATASSAELRYWLHELREEAGHSLMFVEFMARCGLPNVPTPRFGLSVVNAVARAVPFDSVAFWVAVWLGEEISDRINRSVRAAPQEEVCPVVRQIVTLHAIDEARHIAAARRAVEERLEGVSEPGRRRLTWLANLLVGRFVEYLYYPGEAVYRAAGLPGGHNWARRARRNPARARFLAATLDPLQTRLHALGLGIHLQPTRP